MKHDTETCNSISYEHNKRIFNCRMSCYYNYLNLAIAWHTVLSNDIM